MSAPQNQPPYTPPPSGPGPGSPAKSKRSISVGQMLAGILLVLVVVFIVENTESVKIRIIAGPKVSAPVYVALLIAAVVGALIAWLMRARRQRRNK